MNIKLKKNAKIKIKIEICLINDVKKDLISPLNSTKYTFKGSIN